MDRYILLSGVAFFVVGGILFFTGLSLSAPFKNSFSISDEYDLAPVMIFLGIVFLIFGFLALLIGGISLDKKRRLEKSEQESTKQGEITKEYFEQMKKD